MYRAYAWTVTTPGFVGDYLGAQISLTLLLEDCLRDAPQHWRRDPGRALPAVSPTALTTPAFKVATVNAPGFP